MCSMNRMAHFKSTYPYLLVLLDCVNDPVLRNKILKNPKVVQCISELAYNILKENVKVSTREKKQLQKHRKNLYKLATKGRNKLTLLKGPRGAGLLTTLLTIGIPVLASLILDGSKRQRQQRS